MSNEFPNLTRLLRSLDPTLPEDTCVYDVDIGDGSSPNVILYAARIVDDAIIGGTIERIISKDYVYDFLSGINKRNPIESHDLH